jgi:hypothetical protein
VITIFQARFSALCDNLQRLLDAIARRGEPDVRVVDVSSAPPHVVRELTAGSSVIAIDQSLVNAATWDAPNGSPVYHVESLRPRAYYRDVVERLLEAPARRAFLANSDLHDPRDDANHRWFGGRVEALFWMFERPPRRPTDLPPQYVDPWLDGTHDVRDAWCRTIAAFPIRVDTWFAVDDDDLGHGRTPGRGPWDLCVPGAPYATRRIAARAAADAGLSVAPFQGVHRLLRGAARAAHRVLPARWSARANIGVQRAFQRAMVGGARAVFVCGSGAGYPVFKFLEVPAARRAMLTYPCVGFEDYGFRDGEHAIVTIPEDVGRDARRLLGDPALRDALVDRAWRLVAESHTMTRRSAQVVECLRRFRQGRLHAAGFVDGEFEIR